MTDWQIKSSTRKKITSLINEEINDGVILGSALLVGDIRENIYREGFGYAESGKTIPMTPDTIIDIASMTKVLATITALLICHDRGLIDFNKPFIEYLPDFQAKLFDTPPSVRELAAHISGFSHDNNTIWPRQYDAETGPEILRNIQKFPPLFSPRQHQEYTCWNFLLLGLIVERITGKSLKEFCRQEIFKPLEMHDTSLGTPVTDDLARLAQTIGTEKPGKVSDFNAVCKFSE